MLSAERDQTPTVTALREIETFLRLYPNSKYTADVLTLQRTARDRLSESEFRVGLFYFRSRWYRGAIPRFETILKENPEYLHRDAVYYHLAESMLRTGRTKEAFDMFNKLVAEFKVSEYLDETQERITELTRLRDAAEQKRAVEATSSPTAAE
jgi:outer membrane protein assembly factor BamD (BamD/ComL family)